MGVRGLTTYINQKKKEFLQDHLLHDCCLVIDGHSLCAQLFRLLNSFAAFGGDYDRFGLYVRNFFKNLKKCNITPYVLFDGSHEKRKLKTIFSRLRSKIYGASKLDPVTQGSIQIFPLLFRDVFIEALVDMNVAYTVCEFEADDELAAMARHLNCPVLSYDSDFFIYNVLYIPFNTLDYRPKPIDIDGTKTFVMECKIYRVEHMVRNFGGLKEELLPLLATLLGNDFVEKKVFRKFFSQLKLPKTKKKMNDQQKSIHGLFQWLQNETLESAIAKILGRLKKKEKDKVLVIIKKSIDGYHSTHCRSLKYFNLSEDTTPVSDWQLPEGFEETLKVEEEEENDDDDPPDDDASSNEEQEEEIDEGDEGDDGIETDDTLVLGVPEWFAEGIRHKYIPKTYINLYTHHIHICAPQAEDYTQDDSCICCLPIMRFAFDLLVDFPDENCVYICREKHSSYKRLYIGTDVSVPRPFNITFSELTEEQLKSCFHHFLRNQSMKLDMNSLEILPPNFQLFFIALLYWVKNCDVPLGILHSLIMCYVMLEAIDERTGSFRGYFQFNNQYAKKVEELKKTPTTLKLDENDYFLNKNKVLYEDCLVAAHVLLKHFEMDDKIIKKPKSYDQKKMHSFAQFQCCLHHLNSLNTLCRNPFVPTKYSKSFNGTFVYNVSLKLENQADPKGFFDMYLKGATTVLMFYKSICKVYEKFAAELDLKTTAWMGKKKRQRKRNQVDDELKFILKEFESEVYI